jgi:hypothetical protein
LGVALEGAAQQQRQRRALKRTTTTAKIGQATEPALGGEELTVCVDGLACSTVGVARQRKQHEVTPALRGTDRRWLRQLDWRNNKPTEQSERKGTTSQQ